MKAPLVVVDFRSRQRTIRQRVRKTRRRRRNTRSAKSGVWTLPEVDSATLVGKLQRLSPGQLRFIEKLADHYLDPGKLYAEIRAAASKGGTR